MSLIVLIIFSCEEKIELDLKNKSSDLLIVEGVMTNEKTNHLVRLSTPFSSPNGSPIPVSGATVIIFENDQANLLQEVPSGSGLYFTDSIRAVFGNFYSLYIKYENKEFIATDIQSPGETLDPASYAKTDDGLFTLNFVPTGSSPNYIEYGMSWKGSAFCNQQETPCLAKVVYYDLKTTGTQELFKPNKSEVRFPEGTVILRRKYSVSDQYREFLRGMMSETEWRGGPFDNIPANATTNLSQGATGFFAVSTVLSDTVVIE